MKTVTVLELRSDAQKILRQVQQGERLVLTYRGKPMARLEPITEETAGDDDPFYTLHRHAGEAGGSLSNRDIDAIMYGSRDLRARGLRRAATSTSHPCAGRARRRPELKSPWP